MKRKTLTLKQRLFSKRYVELRGNGRKAALDSYDTNDPDTANAIAVENLQKPSVRQDIERQLEVAGLNHTYLDDSLRKLADAGLDNLQATKPDTLLKAIITANKLLDRFPAEKRLDAKLDINKLYNPKTTSEIEKELIAIQKQNRLLLATLKKKQGT